jgi:hypothetical protein
MWDLIIFLVIIIIIAIIIVWYFSGNIKENSKTIELSLDNDDDKIISQWLKDNTKTTFIVNNTNEQIAANFLQRIYHINVHPDNIAIGHNLEMKYYQLTKKQLLPHFSENEDCILYLRSVIGMNYELCIINSMTSNEDLESLISELSDDDINLQYLNDIMLSNNDKKAYEHLRLVLNTRWRILLDTNSVNTAKILNVIDNDDSFLYFNDITCKNIDDPNYDNINNLFKNVKTLKTSKGYRLNLLCSSEEFDNFIQRFSALNAVLNNVPAQN